MHYITLHGDADQVGNFFCTVRYAFGRGLNSRPGLDIGACGEVYRLKYSVYGTPDGGAGPAHDARVHRFPVQACPPAPGHG